VKHHLLVLSVATGVSLMGDALAITAIMLDFHARGAGGAAIAALFTALALPSVVLAGPAGRVADRVPLKRVLRTAGTAMVLVCAAMACTRDVVIVVLLTAVLSGLMAPVTPAMLKAVARSTPDALLSRAQARMSMAANTGMLLGPAVAGVLMETADLRIALLIDAGTYLVLPVSAWLLPPADVARPARRGSGLIPGLRASAAQPKMVPVVAF
jgi:MFS family permease